MSTWRRETVQVLMTIDVISQLKLPKDIWGAPRFNCKSSDFRAESDCDNRTRWNGQPREARQVVLWHSILTWFVIELSFSIRSGKQIAYSHMKKNYSFILNFMLEDIAWKVRKRSRKLWNCTWNKKWLYQKMKLCYRTTAYYGLLTWIKLYKRYFTADM